MPAAEADLRDDTQEQPAQSRLPFAPITRSHIIHCSVHFWHPLLRTLTPKTRLVPLSAPFIRYLGSDGIVLPPDAQSGPTTGSGFSDDECNDAGDNDDETQHDPSLDWPEVHEAVQATIQELGGKVHPKLNWSAPKDATWISATNSMECINANDIYLLLKSSDFVSHDLAHAFDGCADHEPFASAIPYNLVLRKSIPAIITSMEFRCFVRDRTLIGICQRDLNHYDFMTSLLPILRSLIGEFFTSKLRDKFPDPNYTFDVYIPQPQENGRVWLIDINPWAPRTDPLLFSWMELLSGDVPRTTSSHMCDNGDRDIDSAEGDVDGNRVEEVNGSLEDEDEEEEVSRHVEFRVVNRDDPEAYSFTTPLYSAHKLPKEVVEAGMTSGGIREFIERWNHVQFDATAGESESDSGSDHGSRDVPIPSR